MWFCQLLFISVVFSIYLIKKPPDSGDCCPAGHLLPRSSSSSNLAGARAAAPMTSRFEGAGQSHPAPSSSGRHSSEPADSAPHEGWHGPEKGIRVPALNSSEAEGTPFVLSRGLHLLAKFFSRAESKLSKGTSVFLGPLSLPKSWLV